MSTSLSASPFTYSYSVREPSGHPHTHHMQLSQSANESHHTSQAMEQSLQHFMVALEFVLCARVDLSFPTEAKMEPLLHLYARLEMSQ